MAVLVLEYVACVAQYLMRHDYLSRPLPQYAQGHKAEFDQRDGVAIGTIYDHFLQKDRKAPTDAGETRELARYGLAVF